MNITKTLDVFKSQNFFIALISVVLIGFTANGISTGSSATDIYTLFTTNGTFSTAVIAFVFQVGVQVYNHVQTVAWSWGFIKSANFLAGLLSVVSVVLASLIGDTYAGLIIALVVQVVNAIWHIMLPVGQNAVIGAK